MEKDVRAAVALASSSGGVHDRAADTPEELKAARCSATGRAGRPDEVGHLAAFLASEEASCITGQLVVEGGNIIQENKGP